MAAEVLISNQPLTRTSQERLTLSGTLCFPFHPANFFSDYVFPPPFLHHILTCGFPNLILS